MKKKNKRYFLLLLSIIFSVCFCLPSISLYSASALEKDEYDITEYDWANYFDISAVDEDYMNNANPYPEEYTFAKTTTGIDVLFHGQYATVFDSLSFSLCDFDSSLTSVIPILPDLVENERYILTCRLYYYDTNNSYKDFFLYFTASNDNVWAYRLDSEFDTSWAYSPFLSTYGTVLCELNLTFSEREEFAEGDIVHISDIAVYKGSTTYDYTPYFYSLETLPGTSPEPDVPDVPDDGSYKEGYEDGYSNGYTEGLNYSKYSFFYNCKFDVNVLLSDSSSVKLRNLSPYYVFDGITFAPLIAELSERGYTTSNTSGVSLDINFNTLVPLSVFHVRGVGYVDAFANNFDMVLSSATGTQTVTGRWVDFSAYDDPSYPKIGYGIQSRAESLFYEVAAIKNWTIYNLDNLNSLVLMDYTADYQSGYEVGLADGIEKGQNIASEDIYDKAYNDGYVVGKGQGFEEGLSQGLSDDPYSLGDFMYTFIDMPGRFLGNLLNFDFLGINLAGLVTSVITILIMAWILKKVL